MANPTLHGKKVAILVADGFEQVELLEPKKALDEAGAETKLVSPAQGKVKGWNLRDWGKEVPVDVPLDSASADDFDALLLPGGVMNPYHLRMIPKAIEFVKRFVDSNKPIAAICHGPWTLIEANAVRGHRITSWPSLKTDRRNAGAEWVGPRSDPRQRACNQPQARRYPGIQPGDDPVVRGGNAGPSCGKHIRNHRVAQDRLRTNAATQACFRDPTPIGSFRRSAGLARGARKFLSERISPCYAAPAIRRMLCHRLARPLPLERSKLR